MTTSAVAAGERTVLLVDDDDAIREVARVALEIIAKWRVSTARSGPEAVQMAKAELPDVMLLDVMMPGVDGPSTVTMLREDPTTRDLPVIFLTAKEPLADDPDQSEYGVCGVIAKPFDPLTLPDQISRLLGWT